MSISLISPAHREQFQRDGYFILENVVPPEHLQLLRDKVMQNIARIDAEMEEKGVEKLGINHKGSRYFVGAYRNGDQEIGDFIFSDLMAEVTR
ncbi:MAG: phytanoyl-CoA dioxygenase family protein, partial [Armatimonadetes bacterium]|nr:phytanoyl-CoA dioxygenase family protein [Armatimonadota bacterium]